VAFNGRVRYARVAAALLACLAAGALSSIAIAKSSGRAASAAYYYYCPGGSAGSNYGYCPPTTTTTTTPQPPPPVPAQHYVAYDRQEPEQFFEELTLVDQFGSHRHEIEETEFLLTPAEKRRTGRPAEPILRPDAHLTCHGIDPPQTYPVRNVTVSNQFYANSTLTLGRPVWLCAPASKTLTGTPGAPPAPANHYLCYDVRSESPSFRSETLTTVDQFGTRSARVDRTREFCNPVEKRRDGRPAEPIVRPADHLACIRISTFTPAFSPRNVFTRDQFSLETVRVATPRRLCTPSTKHES
jgi:hypothetical protein